VSAAGGRSSILRREGKEEKRVDSAPYHPVADQRLKEPRLSHPPAEEGSSSISSSPEKEEEQPLRHSSVSISGGKIQPSLEIKEKGGGGG